MSQETNWKLIHGYEGLYEISEVGQIRSLHKRNYNCILKPRIDRAGYLTVRLSSDSTTSTKYVHRLLATTFIPNPGNKGYVNHKNGNKLDNSLGNLEWCTHQENVMDAYNQGLNSSAKRISDSITGNIYRSIAEAAKAIGINYNTCCKRLEKNLPSFRLRYVG